jgi:putative lipoic acid-binding regulatory protein
MKKSEDQEKFRELLNEEYTWPSMYTFKFIVPADKEDEVRLLFPEQAEVSIKPSSKGKYTSLTSQCSMNNADEIIDIYEKAAEIEGIISL